MTTDEKKEIVRAIVQARLRNPEEISEVEFGNLQYLMGTAFGHDHVLEVTLSFAKRSLEKDWAGYCRRVEELKKRNALPEDISPEELGALIFAPPDGNVSQELTPNQPVWRVQGAKNSRELRKLTIGQRIALWEEMSHDGRLDSLLRVFVKALSRAYKNNKKLPIASEKALLKDADRRAKDSLTLQELNQNLQTIAESAHLSPQESLVVFGWLSDELPVPEKKRKRRGGEIKDFAQKHHIPPKNIHQIERRALDKLKSAEVNNTELRP